jgi:hypothetical protein
MPNPSKGITLGDKLYYPITEVAPLLGISDVRLRQQCSSGQIPAFKIGRDWVLNPVDARIAREKLANNYARTKRARPQTKEDPTDGIDDLL